jgi:hypothetical protein
MADAATIERLRAYLRDLSPRARQLLVGELEGRLARGADLAGAELVLDELRLLAREHEVAAPRVDDSARLFFKPLEPFLIDGPGLNRHPGRIARGSLDMLWAWIQRDILPDDAKLLDDNVQAALRIGDTAQAEYYIRGFQDKVSSALSDSLRLSESDVKVRRQMLAQIGTQYPGEDAAALNCVLRSRDGLNALAARLPVAVPNLVSGQLDECKALIEKVCARDGDLYPFTLLTVMNRLVAPWQLIRLGVKAAGSDTAARVAETPFGVSVTIVLSELERRVERLRDDLRQGRGATIGASLKAIHDSARGLRTELDLPVNSSWGRSLSALRGQTADLLRLEIESMPGRVKRLLRPRPATDIGPHSALDPKEVIDTEALVAFVGNCRNFASELAINEMTQRTCTDLQQYLDSGTQALLEALRQSGPGERGFRQSQLDAAMRLCATVFGPDYAAQLGKAAEAAMATAVAAERKAQQRFHQKSA